MAWRGSWAEQVDAARADAVVEVREPLRRSLSGGRVRGVAMALLTAAALTLARPVGAWLVAVLLVVAAALAAGNQHLRRLRIRVDEEAGVGWLGPGNGVLPQARDWVTDVLPVRRDEVVDLVRSGEHGRRRVDLERFLAQRDPDPTRGGEPEDTVGLLVVPAGRRDPAQLLPVWNGRQARRLDAAVRRYWRLPEGPPVSSHGALDATTVADAARTRVGALLLAVMVPGAVLAAVLVALPVVEAATIDLRLGGGGGRLVTSALAGAGIVAVTAALATVLVAVTAVLVWQARGRPVGPADALLLGVRRVPWVLVQLWPLLLGAAVAWSFHDAGYHRFARYALLSLGWIAIAQVVLELVGRTWQEAWTRTPEPLVSADRGRGRLALVITLFVAGFTQVL